MKILVIGSGGREHALVWKIKQSPYATKIFCAPGNAGIAQLAETVPIASDNIQGLLRFATDQSVDLTVVGPEQPLTQGIVDEFESRGLKIFGPSKSAAELEGSKVFAKQFMKKYQIPTSEFRSFGIGERFDAERYISEIPVPLVIKADGLAAGKGVIICDTKEQALDTLDLLFSQRIFGDAGTKIVIEEFLVGEEASVFAISDGRNFVVLPPAQDHKRIFDGDNGKNTGGMGAYAPAPVVTGKTLDNVKKYIITPTLEGMLGEGKPYKGCLYVGLMITATGPKVIEYNCRFGDPETQVVVPLINGDIVQMMLDSVNGKIDESKIKSDNRTAVCVVIASGGYPDKYETDKQILGLDKIGTAENVMVFHSGTKKAKDGILTAGGRVLGVTAFGESQDLEGTIDKAYRAVERITFDGAYYRSDIGKKGIEHQRIQSQEKE